MPTSNIDPRKYSFLIIALLVILVPLVMYYFVYVPGQRDYFTQRNLRLLGVMATKIESKLNSQTRILKSAASNIASLKNLKNDNSVLQALGQADNLELVGSIKTDTLTAPAPENIHTWLNRIEGEYWIYFDYSRSFASAEKGSGSLRLTLRARSNLQDLIGPLTENDIFSNLLLIRKNGEVIFQNNKDDLRLTRIDTILRGKTNPGPKALQTTVSDFFDIPLGGSIVKLFLQPVTVPIFTAPEGSQSQPAAWAVCGLITAREFTKSTLSINYLFIVGFMILVLIAVLCWPLLKIIYMGPNDRLRLTDVLFLIFSSLIGTAVVIMALTEFYLYRSMTSKMDRQLHVLAGHISANFQSEINDSYRQLKQYEPMFKPPLLKAQLDKKRRIRLLENPQDSLFPRQYPYLDMVYWMDSTGRQRIKWSRSDHTTTLINVSAREYFSRIIARRYWSKPLANQPVMNFWIEPIYSWNTGENLTVISTPVDNDTLKTAALVTRPIAVMNPILPAGFGFAIIDEEGNVLYHSDERHNLQENLFKECDDDRWLLSAVLGKKAENGSVQYQGKGYRFVVRPLKDIPWYLVVFRDKEIFRSINLEILTVAMLLFVLYIFIFLIIAGLIYLVHPDYRAKWVWPDKEKGTGPYLRLLISFGLLGMAFLAWIIHYSSFQMLPSAFLLPFFALVLAYMIMNRTAGAGSQVKETDKIRHLSIARGILWFIIGMLLFTHIVIFRIYIPAILLAILMLLLIPEWEIHSFPQPEKLMSFPHLYTLALTFLVLVTSCLPAIAFYKFAYHAETELFIKHAQLLFSRAIVDRRLRIQEEYSKFDRPDSLLAERLSLHQKDIYSDFFFDTQIRFIPRDSAAFSPEKAWKWQFKDALSKVMPLYNQTTIESRGLIHNINATGTWRWGRLVKNDTTILRFSRVWTGTPAASRLEISTRLPGFLTGETPYVSYLLLLGIIIFGMFLVMRFIARRIFLLELESGTLREYQDFSKMKDQSHNIILIGPPSSNKSALLSKKVRLVIDLARLNPEKSWEDLVDKKALSGSRVIGIDHFEHKIDDPIFNKFKLQVLEDLVYSYHKKIIIATSVNPLQYFASEGWGKAEEKADGQQEKKPTTQQEEYSRWTNLLGSFLPYFHQAGGDDKKFHTRLTTIKNNRLKQPGRIEGKNGTKGDLEFRERFENMFAFLEQECAYSTFLQDIAIQIARNMPMEEFTEENLIYRVLYLSENFYSALWQTFTREEKFIAVHLAENSFINYKNIFTTWRLMHRKIVIRDPIFRLMNQSFAKFVLSQKQSGELIALEKEERRRSPWARLKVPILIILLGITVFLFTTQPDVFDTTFGFVTAIAAGIPAVLRLLDLFQRSRAPVAPKS